MTLSLFFAPSFVLDSIVDRYAFIAIFEKILFIYF